MPENIAIRPADLLVDENNPRLGQPNSGQRPAFRSLASHNPRKLVALARDIVENGLDPSNLPIVTRLKGDSNRYVVLEGNRRLAALKALESPENLVDVVDKEVLGEFRELSRRYQEDPVETVTCLVVKDRDEANHWIELRHTGENKGAGVVPWGSDEAARFKARGGQLELHSQALNFMEKAGVLTAEQRRKVPAASFKRLLGTPAVREKLGIELKDGQLVPVGDADKVAAALFYVANDLSTGRTKTKDIYERDQRVDYAKALPKSVVVPRSRLDGRPAARKAVAKKKPAPAPYVRPRPREYLIPADCSLNIPSGRCRDIEHELRFLNFAEYPNATAVLFRVFVELSVDAYIDKQKLASPEDPTLRSKLVLVTNDLLARQKLTRETAAPVRRATQKDSFFAPSIALMHQYVHGGAVFPSPGDLRAGWDSLQPFFVAIWSA